MKLELRIANKQNQTMTPRLQQAIKLLQLSTPELEAEIKTALESNPMLEDLSISTVCDYSEPNIIYRPAYSADYDFEQENFSASEPSLQDHLHWQLNLTPFSDRDRIIALNIIDSIDDDGYLKASIEELKQSIKTNYPVEFAQIETIELATVLRRIQHFDPIGVASRDLKECMLIQLEAMPTAPYINLCKKIVTDHLQLLAEKKYSQIKSMIKIRNLEFDSILHTLKQLHPRPGEIISNQKVEYIIPDVTVSKKNNIWLVELNKDLATNIRVNPSYAALIKRADSSRDNNFLREQLVEARWFLNGIKNRNEALLKVATCIIRQQSDFLEQGEEKMKPMILQDIAQATGLNESTISRITTQKYIYTPRGVYELKFFFSSHVANENGDNCSSTAIKAIIKQLISKEEAEHRLTDQDLMRVMAQRGIKLARRTVAKYREALGIKCSNQRKNY